MATVRIRLLGTVAVERDGAPVERDAPTEQGVLAFLAAHAGEAVPREALRDELWEDLARKDPEEFNPLRIAVTRVRKWLGEDGPSITAAARRYTLRIDPDAVDLLRFLRLAAAALTGADLAAHETAEAVWTGRPFPDLSGRRLDAVRAHAEDRHRALLLRHAALLREAGRADEAVEVLHRPDDGLAVPYLEALVAAGRHGEALAAARELLDDLDEPGPELQALHDQLARRPAVGTLPGREHVLRSVLALLDGPGGLVVVTGLAGSGKSAVLRALLRDARAVGARTAASAWGEGDAPVASWNEVAADLAVPGAPLRPAELAVRLHEHLVRTSADRLLVVLDDAHRADSASLDVLRTLVRRELPRGTVLVVAARSPDVVDRPHWSSAIADLATDGHVPTELGPLPDPVVRSLVRARLAHLDPDDELVTAVARRGGGHALHLTALLDEAARTDSRAAAARAVAAVPTRVRAVLAHQVDRLPAGTRRALEALAVLHPVDLTGLAAVLEESPLAVADALDPARRAGLLTGHDDRYALRHDLDVDGLRAGVPAVRCAHLHAARLAQLPEDADVFVVLRHTVGAASLLDPAHVASARIAAGIEAYRVRALPEALVLLDAASATADATIRVALLVYRALCRSVLGGAGEEDPDDALDEALTAALAGDDDELALLAAMGDEPLGLAIDGDLRRLARLRRLAQRPLPPRLRLELLTGLIREEGATGERPAEPAMDEALGLADVVAAEDSLARARVRALQARHLVDVADPALDRLAIAQDAYRLAVETDVPALHLDATELLMSAELTTGNTERAHKLRAELQALAERWFRPRAMWAALVVEAAMLLAEGDPAADEAAQRASTRGTELGLSAAPMAAGAHLLMRHLLGNSSFPFGPLAAQASAQVPNTAVWAAAAAFGEVRAGNDDEARVHLAEYRRRAANPSMWFKRAALALAAGAAFGLGDVEVATEVRAVMPSDPDAAVLVGYGGAVIGPVCLWTGLAAWTVGDVEAARQEITAAVAFADRAGWPPWSAAVRQALAAVDDPAAPLPFGLPRGHGVPYPGTTRPSPP